MIALVSADEALQGRVERVARAAGHEVAVYGSLDATQTAAEPSAAIVDLDTPGAAGAAQALRSRWRRALLAASIPVPDRSRWEAALESGYDLVATRGTVAAQTIERLAEWKGPRRRERVRLFDHADVVGRIGLVHRAETPVGSIAVFRLGSDLHAIEDVCPHAGAKLSGGELAAATLTCPRHGSQFDVRTGERVRGPADRAISSYDLVVEEGIVWLELPERA